MGKQKLIYIMKIFRFFGVAVITLCMCVNFSACSNGDDAGSGDFAGERKLVKMVMTDGDNTETYKFSYDNQGRVTEARIGDEDWAWNHIFIWENNTVKVLDDGAHRCTYTIENGLVRSSYHPEDFERSYTQYYTYNLADKLVRESGEYYSEYTWNGDKLISMVGSGEFDVTYSYEDVYCKKGYLPMLSWDPIHMAHPELFGIPRRSWSTSFQIRPVSILSTAPCQRFCPAGYAISQCTGTARKIRITPAGTFP